MQHAYTHTQRTGLSLCSVWSRILSFELQISLGKVLTSLFIWAMNSLFRSIHYSLSTLFVNATRLQSREGCLLRRFQLLTSKRLDTNFLSAKFLFIL